MKTCSKCKLTMTVEEFGTSSSWCKICRKNHEKDKRREKGMKERIVPIILENAKQCLKCMEILSLDKFSPSKKNISGLGLSSYCKDCFIKFFKRSKEDARKATQKYRDKDRLAWRAKNRLHQFNRKRKVKATCDGTINSDFLKKLFNNDKCCYCNKICSEEEKTIEHIVPLNKGGLHTSSNVNMSCFSCNSSKRDRTEEEFLNDIRKNNM